MVIYSQWCRIEGNIINDIDDQYGVGTLKHLDKQKIFYGTPEVQIHNPSSLIHGCKYLVIPISNYGYKTIQEIDTNYDELLTKVQQENKDATLGDYYYTGFTIEESSIILHNDSTKPTLDLVAYVWVDKTVTPSLKGITANYSNTNICVGDEFDTKNVLVTAIYSDGSSKIIVDTGYAIYDSDGNVSKKVSQIGSNTFRIVYSEGDKTFQTSIIVPGIKKLTGITAIYDGPNVATGNAALKKYFVVSGVYSDNTSSIITEFTFPKGAVITKENAGVIDIYYKGFTTTATVPSYEVKQSRLIAAYNGPNIEVGKTFDANDVSVKLYYIGSDDSNNYNEIIKPSDCTFATTKVDHEGINYITITYNGKLGAISTQFAVVGIKTKVVLNYLTGTYLGKPITVGKSFDITQVLVKGYYSDNSVTIVNKFSIDSNVIKTVGRNEFTVSYKDKTVVVEVTGLAKEDTTNTSFNEIKIENQYPSGTYRNHRYRGPAESYKANEFSEAIQENINRLYDRFYKLESKWRKTIQTENGYMKAKYDSLHTITAMKDTMNECAGKEITNE